MRILILFLLSVFCTSTYAADPFGVSFSEINQGTDLVVRVSVTVPPHHHIYADQVAAELVEGTFLRPVGGDKPVRLHDSYSDSDRDSFTNSFALLFGARAALTGGVDLTFSYQGCSEKECFFPRKVVHRILASQSGPTSSPVSANSGSTVSHQSEWEKTGQSHHVGARASGYLSAPDFLSFLDRAEGRVNAGEASTGSVVRRIKAGFLLFSDNPAVFLETHGVWWTLLLILLGGLLLNLTPCVLPMIPINLAILGVGSQSRSKGRGILLGSAYGVGIAFVYGVLGLVVVLTGAQFGTLNSFPWFNALIGFLFVVLALAMFDVWVIDFTRFQSNAVDRPERKRGGIVTAVVMGGVSALLAGACVAPVVIAVLLLSGNLYGQGVVIGLILPFVLGVGMALPWPLAGAGLTVLPKPGIWMRWIKVGFGVFILLFAFYYFSLAYRGWRGETAVLSAETGVSSISVTDHVKWRAILKDSVAENKPVFVDVWATWCKNCETMELTTFRDAAVRDRLSKYRVVKLQVEKFTDPAARRVTDYFEIKGLPTYLILSPETAP